MQSQRQVDIIEPFQNSPRVRKSIVPPRERSRPVPGSIQEAEQNFLYNEFLKRVFPFDQMLEVSKYEYNEKVKNGKYNQLIPLEEIQLVKEPPPSLTTVPFRPKKL